MVHCLQRETILSYCLSSTTLFSKAGVSSLTFQYPGQPGGKGKQPDGENDGGDRCLLNS